MKINSKKKAVITGLVSGTCTFVAFALFTCFLYFLLDGEFFVSKGATRDSINGISFNVVKIAAVVVSSVIPMLLIQFKNISYYILCLVIATVLYIVYFVAYLFCVFSLPIEWALNFPMNSFDALFYGGFYFPLGAIIGALFNLLINSEK